MSAPSATLDRTPADVADGFAALDWAMRLWLPAWLNRSPGHEARPDCSAVARQLGRLAPITDVATADDAADLAHRAYHRAHAAEHYLHGHAIDDGNATAYALVHAYARNATNQTVLLSEQWRTAAARIDAVVDRLHWRPVSWFPELGSLRVAYLISGAVGFTARASATAALVTMAADAERNQVRMLGGAFEVAAQQHLRPWLEVIPGPDTAR